MNAIPSIQFLLGSDAVRVVFGQPGSPEPDMTVLEYLRSYHRKTGVHEGCGQGDCGACTIVLASPGPGQHLRYEAVNACLLFLPMLDAKQVISIHELSLDGRLHPVQEALLGEEATQCGFCTPGIAMSLFDLYHSETPPEPHEIPSRLSGNLCRCTGYASILRAAGKLDQNQVPDSFDESEARVLSQLRQWENQKTLLRIQGSGISYFRPATLREALALKEEFPSARLVAGASDLAVEKNRHLKVFDEFIDISELEALKVHDINPGGILLGAGTSINSAINLLETALPELATYLKRFASWPIGNRATLGGNIATASPVGDLIPALMALNTTVVLENTSRRKKVLLEDFIRDYRRTFIHPDEIITAIMIPRPESQTRLWFFKASKRREVDISTINAGFMFRFSGDGRIAESRLFVGGMADRVVRLREAEVMLEGSRLSPELAEKAASQASRSLHPWSDARSTAQGRILLLRNLMIRCALELSSPITQSSPRHD